MGISVLTHAHPSARQAAEFRAIRRLYVTATGLAAAKVELGIPGARGGGACTWSLTFGTLPIRCSLVADCSGGNGANATRRV